MPDILEAVKKWLGSFTDDDPKMPLHIGSAMSCWLYLTTFAEASNEIQIALNTTVDSELIKALDEALKIFDSQVEHLREFMKAEGVPLPRITGQKPESNPSAIPAGVKLSDDEIANALSLKVATAIVSCATAASQSIRADVGAMWMSFLTQHFSYANTLKSLMRKRDWLKVPPPYFPPGVPNQ